MYPPPTGPTLSEEQIKELDDAFLASNPTGYFRSRIDSLVSWADAPTDSPASDLAHRMSKILGPMAEARKPTSDADKRLQVIVDALQIRHHAAEALLRLLLARIICRSASDARSLWLTLIETPNQMTELVERLRPSAEAEDFISVAAGLLLPVPAGTQIRGNTLDSVRTAARWMARAAEVVSCGHIDLNAANNKVKHGLTARPEENLRVTFTTTPLDKAGNPTLSSLTGPDAFDIFDTTVVEYVSRPPEKPRHGFERTLLRADPALLLSEAWMAAVVHGALFHTAAKQHFAGRDEMTIAPHPGISTGPTPEQVLRGHAVGMRFPLTTPPGGGPSRRPAGLAMPDGFFPLEFGEGWSGTVTED